MVAAFLAFSLWGVNTKTFSDLLLVDPFSVFFKLLFMGIAALVILASKDYASKLTGFMGEYYALIMLSTVGMMLMAAARARRKSECGKSRIF